MLNFSVITLLERNLSKLALSLLWKLFHILLVSELRLSFQFRV